MFSKIVQKNVNIESSARQPLLNYISLSSPCKHVSVVWMKTTHQNNFFLHILSAKIYIFTLLFPFPQTIFTIA